MSETLTAALWAITPTVLLGAIFWFIVRAIIRVDRTERAAFSKVEAEERQRRGLPPRPAAPVVADAAVEQTSTPASPAQ
ncbi:hypothetical protein GCM10022198_25980 [Klugiella xanthotipulae]|uniref:Uncharacterized protein n=1 Tax=Klugiella xanthotipulae TaxID=244735 RepID=A0A543I5L9_9MICO|nr:hypothetical protein [Klugiella xanthotipulae]TQM65868.1 hypothetical protein FB466_0685 [Klugiella xanthotipulae]